MRGPPECREPGATELWGSGAEDRRGQSVKVTVGQEECRGGCCWVMEGLLRSCRIRSSLVRECMAECLGVYILILFGCGSVAQVTTSGEKNGHYLSINLGFALGVTFGVFVSRGVSGGHLNPAVSLSLCALGRCSWFKLPFYVFFQVLGGFLAAATVALQYYDAIMMYGGGSQTVTGPHATAGIFSTYPAHYLSKWGGVMDQVIGTAALLLCILAVGDRRNTPVPACLQPPLAGATVLVIGVSMGSNSGYAVNPARDFGPRLFTYIAGWGEDVFRAGDSWWWVPIVAPCIGGLLGALVYELMVEIHHPALPEEERAAEGDAEVELGGVKDLCKTPAFEQTFVDSGKSNRL